MSVWDCFFFLRGEFLIGFRSKSLKMKKKSTKGKKRQKREDRNMLFFVSFKEFCWFDLLSLSLFVSLSFSLSRDVADKSLIEFPFPSLFVGILLLIVFWWRPCAFAKFLFLFYFFIWTGYWFMLYAVILCDEMRALVWVQRQPHVARRWAFVVLGVTQVTVVAQFGSGVWWFQSFARDASRRLVCCRFLPAFFCVKRFSPFSFA